MDSHHNEPTVATETTNDVKSSDRAEEDRPQHLYGDGASPAKIFIGGLARDTTTDQFNKHFGKYGEITDSVIMKDRNTGQPRGFGFVTYADASVVDEVIKNDHIINGKQVEIKRTIPKGAGGGSKDLKTKKIFVGGIPATVTDDELKDFFMQFGEVKEHQIMRDHSTSRSRGFGFVSFDTEQAVDDLLAKGNRLDFADAQVEIKKAEPRKTNPAPAPSKRYNDSRPTFGRGSYGDAYGGFEDGGRMGAGYRSAGAYERRASAYGGLGGSEFGGYGTYGGGGSMGPYRGEPSPGYSSRYGGGFSRGYDMGGGYGGPGEGYGGYGGAALGGGGYGGAAGRGGGYGGAAGGGYGYGAGLGGGYGAGDGPGAGAGGGSFYGSGRGGYGGAGTGRYHPYGR